MRIVIMGLPGAGKATQAVRLGSELGLARIAPGSILREALQKGSLLGRRVRGYVESGSLVPDEWIGDLVAERLGKPEARRGFVLEGFPRTRAQAEWLDRELERDGRRLDRAILLEARNREIVGRLTGRRHCPGCGRVYHVDHAPPRSQGVCDRCGVALVQRRDDTEAAVLQKLKAFVDQIGSIVQRYREAGLLAEVDGGGEPDEVFRRIRAALERA